jgi:hypothetical protein
MSAASLSRAAEKRYLAAHPGCKLVMGVDEAGRGYRSQFLHVFSLGFIFSLPASR